MSYIRLEICPNRECFMIPAFAVRPVAGAAHAVKAPQRCAPRAVFASLLSVSLMRLLALNKPFGTICQFSPHETRASLADWVKVPSVYPAGRLDSDSEGLLLLTDDGALQARIAEPRHKLVKRYWAQVEGAVDRSHVEEARARRRSRRLRDATVSRGLCRATRIAVDPHTAHPFSRGDTDHVDRTVDHRRQEPSGASHDSSGRFSDTATRACRRRRARYFFARTSAGRERRVAVESTLGRRRLTFAYIWKHRAGR